MTCDRQTSLSEIVSLTSELKIGNVLRVKIRNCQLTADPLETWFTSLGVNTSHIDWLQLSYNRPDSTDQLRGDHMRGLTSLRGLSIVNYNITSLDKTMFQHVIGIKSLDLSKNKGIQLEGNSFTDLKDLEEFTCNSCLLSNLEVNIFQGLTRLRSISLHDNKLSTLPQGIFDTNTALEFISIDRNNLQTLPAHSLDNLVNLTYINLDYNNLTSLPTDLFKYNTNMKRFELKVNGDNNPIFGLGYPMETARRLQLPSSLFPDSLEEITMLWVPLTNVPPTLLQNCKNLVNVIIQRGMITSLPENLLQGLTNLKMVDFSLNRITDLPQNIFKGLLKLERLRFIANNLTSLHERLFEDLHSLKVIHMGRNQIDTVPPNLFSPNRGLEELDLSKNKISFRDKFSNSLLFNLKILDLSFNNISFITNEMRIVFQNLKTLNLSHNSIGDLVFYDIQFLQNNRDGDFTVDLSHNKISKLNMSLCPDCEGATFIPFYLNLTNNPLTCDCDTVALKQLVNRTLPSAINNAVNLRPNELRCGEDNSQMTRNKLLSEVDFRDLNCEN